MSLSRVDPRLQRAQISLEGDLLLVMRLAHVFFPSRMSATTATSRIVTCLQP